MKANTEYKGIKEPAYAKASADEARSPKPETRNLKPET
jgi:hypothetical protein